MFSSYIPQYQEMENCHIWSPPATQTPAAPAPEDEYSAGAVFDSDSCTASQQGGTEEYYIHRCPFLHCTHATTTTTTNDSHYHCRNHTTKTNSRNISSKADSTYSSEQPSLERNIQRSYKAPSYTKILNISYDHVVDQRESKYGETDVRYVERSGLCREGSRSDPTLIRLGLEEERKEGVSGHSKAPMSIHQSLLKTPVSTNYSPLNASLPMNQSFLKTPLPTHQSPLKTPLSANYSSLKTPLPTHQSPTNTPTHHSPTNTPSQQSPPSNNPSRNQQHTSSLIEEVQLYNTLTSYTAIIEPPQPPAPPPSTPHHRVKDTTVTTTDAAGQQASPNSLPKQQPTSVAHETVTFAYRRRALAFM